MLRLAIPIGLVAGGIVLIVNYSHSRSSPSAGSAPVSAVSDGGGPGGTGAPGQPGGGQTHLEPATATPAGTDAAGTPPPAAASTPAGTPTVCSPQTVSLAVETDASRYGPQQAVRYTATVRNDGNVRCDAGGPTGTAVRDSNGAVVSGHAISGVSFGFIDPGQSVSYVQTWDQQHCSGTTCGRAGPGSYIAQVTWGDLGTAGGSFTLTS